MTHDPTNHNPIAIKKRAGLSSLLAITESDTARGSDQLNDTGFLSIAEAFLLGHTRADICKRLNISNVAYISWEYKLPEDEKRLIRLARLQALEELEETLIMMQRHELESQGVAGTQLTDDEQTAAMKQAMLVEKRMKNISEVLSSCQRNITRRSKQLEGEQVEEQEPIITNLIITDEALSYIPK